ncbi:hypothetical protein [Pseudorhodoferax sp. Leaf267]|uniref:hypothetical protein n=1 Tax=Pseudorhodoferax sp. Leaf267 TaxID=1736316 RepID=UPI0006FCF390|nr:hypothetical protein [Pseudorhodoferax sp. Leaf267]KQP20024.1 hypothetical protein ASF43_28085 [Pseudorhodoferax sp. Leaf267]
MFERLRKVLTARGEAPPLAVGPATPLQRWARASGFEVVHQGRTPHFSLTGQLAGKPFRMDRTLPSRAYIVGSELRARVELDIAPEVSVMVISRSLRDALEHEAYADYTGRVRTTLDANMPEEVRWLAMFDEVGWERGAVAAFWPRYAIVADARAHAQAWVKPELMQALLGWPVAADDVPPLLLQLQRGKLYLRMAFVPDDLPTLQHVLQVLAVASATALAGCARPTGPAPLRSA